MEHIYIGLILILSTFVQGFTGFGFSLLAIPLLSIFLDAKMIIIITVTYCLMINSLIIRKYYRDARLKSIMPLLISAIIFTFVGGSFLQSVDEYLLKWIIGIMLVVIGVINNFGIKIDLSKPERYFLPVGAVSGLLNGVAGLSGPPVLVFLSNIDLDRSQFKATLSSYFVTLNVVAILTYVYRGFYTPDNIRVITAYIPHVIIGTGAGMYAANKIEERYFKRIVNAAIPLMGVNIVLKLLG